MENKETIEVLKAIFRVQVEMPAIKKSGTNSFFKSTKNPDGSPYILLEDILEACKPLEKTHNILVMHSVVVSGDDRKFLKSTFTHVESGQTIETQMPLMLQKQDMQGLASAITYAKRQNISCVYNIQTEIDDDGNGSVIHKNEQQTQKKFEPKEKPKGRYFITAGKLEGKHLRDVDPKELDDYLRFMEDKDDPRSMPLRQIIYAFKRGDRE